MIVESELFGEYVHALVTYYQQRAKSEFRHDVSFFPVQEFVVKMKNSGVQWKQTNFYSNVCFYIFNWTPQQPDPRSSLPTSVRTWINERIAFEILLVAWDGFDHKTSQQLDVHIANMHEVEPAIYAWMRSEWAVKPDESMLEFQQFQHVAVKALLQEES